MPGTDLTLPCGSRVRASASYHRREDDPDRGFGLYLDPHWEPTWPSTVVPWVNLGLPHDFEQAVDAIQQAYAKARSGVLVEVGCQGGIGRTGVVIACMAVLAGVEDTQAVAWVRSHYVQRAVETPLQEWWVLWFAARVQGRPPPSRPDT
ncbi:protein-tyrosine phosphatase family protein [Myxococcota bacterium]|nr:protein-tyrosine phosphatase family protein [Myxococcota bacterium]